MPAGRHRGDGHRHPAQAARRAAAGRRRGSTTRRPEPELAAIKALKDTVEECGVPAQPLYDLIQANRQDQLVTRYETYQDLADYCGLSANPVGQVVLYIMGAATPERHRRLR